jgi:hypothetical protein
VIVVVLYFSVTVVRWGGGGHGFYVWAKVEVGRHRFRVILDKANGPYERPANDYWDDFTKLWYALYDYQLQHGGHYPDRLEELVTDGYLRVAGVPITNKPAVPDIKQIAKKPWKQYYYFCSSSAQPDKDHTRYVVYAWIDESKSIWPFEAAVINPDDVQPYVCSHQDLDEKLREMRR